MKRALISVYLLCICFFALADNTIPVFVTPEDFGCVSNDKKQAENNSVGLQKAIDYCMANGSKLTSVASHCYYIKQGLKISGFINIDLGGATIIATDSVPMFTVHWDKTEYWTGIIRNFRLNLNDIARIGINCDKVIKLHLTDGEFSGIGANAIGLNVKEGYELLADNLHFHGNQKYSTGIRTLTSDCHFSDCIMIDCYTAVDNRGSNFFERIHAWMLPRYIHGSTYFRNRGGGVFLNQCFCDTYDKAFVVDNVCEMHISQLKLIHNKIMWKKTYDKVNPIVFDFKSDEVASKSKISLVDSYIGGLWLGNKERQVFSKNANHIETTNSNITIVKNLQ